MSSDRFVDELKAVKKSTEYRVEVAMAMVNGGYLRPEEMRWNGVRTPAMQGARDAELNTGDAPTEDGRRVVSTLRGGQFVVEDKRKRKTNARKAKGAGGR